MAVIEKRVSRDGSVSYRVKVRLRGYAPQSATFKRKTDAERWGQKTETEMLDDKYFPNTKSKKHTVSNLIDIYLNDLKIKNARRYDEVKPLLEWWKAEFGQAVLSHFKSEDVLRGQQRLLSQPKKRRDAAGNIVTLSPATVNRYMVALHTAINFGISPLKWLSANPVNDVEKLKEPQGRTRFLSEDEIARLLAACKESKNKHLFGLVIMGIATGARRKEIQYMRWVDVNSNISRITLPKTKNGEVRAVHLTGIASELIRKMYAQKKDDIFLFPSPHDPKRPVDFESAWNHALKVSDINNFRFHDLRHTCGSYLAMNGASAVELAEALGHKTLQMVRRYAHLTDTHTSSVIGKMTNKVLGHVKI